MLIQKDRKDEGYTMGPVKAFEAFRKAPRQPTSSCGGLERKLAVSEHDCRQNHDEIDKGEHIWLCRYLAKHLGTFMAATELRNARIECGSVCVRAESESERERDWTGAL